TIADYFAGETARIWEIGRLTLHWTPGIAPERLDSLFDEFTQALLVDRNTAWIPVIETAASAHDTIAVAVGAGHLPGKDGLLFQLQQNGWEITRLD
ncbi:MAG: TraB/GumN family protein, partial [Rhodobacteraceae bacterium]|nr:TraB/GumN family protein [Paracoccaceae bacterium]